MRVELCEFPCWQKLRIFDFVWVDGSRSLIYVVLPLLSSTRATNTAFFPPTALPMDLSNALSSGMVTSAIVVLPVRTWASTLAFTAATSIAAGGSLVDGCGPGCGPGCAR